MSIVLETKEVPINQKTVIPFSGIGEKENILSYIVGFSKLTLTYGDDDHHVREINIRIESELSGNQSIAVTPKAVINDDSGHSIDENAMIGISVAAIAGSRIPNIKMATGVSRGEVINMGSSAVFAFPALTRSELRYVDDDHHLAEYTASVSLSNVGGDSFKLSGGSMMKDDGSNRADGEKEEGSVIISTVDGTAYGMAYSTLYSKDAGKEDFIFDPDAYNYAFFVNDYNVEYEDGDDHHVKTIEIGIALNGNNASYTATLKDDSGNETTVSSGGNYVNGFVLGIKK